jgi:hypothetical protein
MKFLLMIHGDETGWDALSEGQQEARREQYGAVARRGEVLRAAELGPTSSATTVRVQDGSTLVTDGPYAETREALGGVFLVEAASFDDALELAQALPAPQGRGGIEVRPVYGDES